MPARPKAISNQQIIGGGIGRDAVVEITAKTATGVQDGNGEDVQWIYRVVEQRKNGSGYGSWTDKEAGDGYTGDAFNFLEDEQPSGAVVMNNNVNHGGADWTSNQFLKEIKVGNRWPAKIVNNPDGTCEAWLMPYNSVDGTC